MALGEKQPQILQFRLSDYSYLICDGAVRSGKTSLMMVGFVDDAMTRFNGRRFGICGKTVDSSHQEHRATLHGHAVRPEELPYQVEPYRQDHDGLQGWRYQCV